MARKQANKKTSAAASTTEEKPVASEPVPTESTELPPLPSGKGAKTTEKEKGRKQPEKTGQKTEEGADEQPQGPKYTLFGLLSHEENRAVAIPFALTAIAMFVIPVGVFFAVQSALPGLGITDNNKVLSYSGISAVISANIIMALYAFYAYQEEKHDWAAVQEKRRQNDKKKD
ncbi:hypothetical protein FOZ61_010288 [Perkinsus olseni]|uniref:Vacuolar ATPase assembly integral membrane protein VMA21 n=1 Tax=Perkinsus olseni TaxID=32597 RepID=A0A7J6M349_PEROL|nr:hypothetical protein FOZ61_010288 [Perkinsus olseni]